MKKPWISEHTTKLAEERREAKRKGNREHWKRQNQEVTRSARNDKNRYLEQKCVEMENEGDKNSKKIFQIMREVTGKWVPKTDAIKDKMGRTLTESDDIKRRRAEYCSELYEGDDEEQMEEMIYERMEPAPLRSEVEWALKHLRDGESPGIDNIPIEMWKASEKEGITLLWKICKMVWRMKELPQDWYRAIFVPLPKKGDKNECANNRTISLIVHASKVILKIIIKRIKKRYREEISEEQAGFVEDKGTRDQIVNIRNIMEKCKNHNIPIYLCFIDYAKAFTA